MKKLSTALLLFSLFGCHSLQAQNQACILKNIPVASIDPSRNDIYIAKSYTFEIQFHNENAPNPADIFPDPLIKIRKIATNEFCEIIDGYGIWSGRSVYLDTSEQTLVLNEFSGSSDTLIFYNPRTCHRLMEFNVSNKLWKILADRIRTGNNCLTETIDSCSHIQEFFLDKQCLFKISEGITIK